MPMPAVIERVDRRMAALYRGADLSSMSSGPAGEGTGASLQEKETDILRRDDAETIAETLEEISRLVIEWYFGNGVEPLARVELVVPVSEDAQKVVTSATTLADRGAKVSTSALMDRLNLPKATDEADALGSASKTPEVVSGQPSAVSGEEIANALETEDSETEDRRLDADIDALRVALAADLKPLGDALFSAYQAGDEAAMMAALKKISTNMPELAGDAAALGDELAAQMVDALVGETPSN
jgi:phage gp29-like protein